jgi:hypothetical protein
MTEVPPRPGEVADRRRVVANSRGVLSANDGEVPDGFEELGVSFRLLFRLLSLPDAAQLRPYN